MKQTREIQVEYKGRPNTRQSIEVQAPSGGDKRGGVDRGHRPQRPNGPQRRMAQVKKFVHIQKARQVNGRIGARFFMGCRGKKVIVTDVGGFVNEGILTEFDDYSFVLDVGDHGGMLIFKGGGMRVHCPERRILRFSPDEQKCVEMSQADITAFNQARIYIPPVIKLDPARARRHYASLGKEIPDNVLTLIVTAEAEEAEAKAKKEAEAEARRAEYEKRFQK